MGNDERAPSPAHRLVAWASALVALLALGAVGDVTRANAAENAPEAEAYQQEIQTWQKKRLERLTSDEGWLVVSGLTWLKEGANPFGSAPSNTVVLPAHSVPAQAGVLRLEGGKVFVDARADDQSSAARRRHRDDRPISSKTALRPDVPGPFDVVAIADVRFFILDREGKIGVRIRDLRSARRTGFKGLEYFPIDSRYRVEAELVPHPQPTKIKVPNVLGYVSDMTSPGKLRFRIGQQNLALDAVIEADGDQRLFVIFRDSTAGKVTYGSGRFVYTDMPKNNKVVLDFNKAYTPPCAFTRLCHLPAAAAPEPLAGRHRSWRKVLRPLSAGPSKGPAPPAMVRARQAGRLPTRHH